MDEYKLGYSAWEIESAWSWCDLGLRALEYRSCSLEQRENLGALERKVNANDSVCVSWNGTADLSITRRYKVLTMTRCAVHGGRRPAASGGGRGGGTFFWSLVCLHFSSLCLLENRTWKPRPLFIMKCIYQRAGWCNGFILSTRMPRYPMMFTLIIFPTFPPQMVKCAKREVSTISGRSVQSRY